MKIIYLKKGYRAKEKALLHGTNYKKFSNISKFYYRTKKNLIRIIFFNRKKISFFLKNESVFVSERLRKIYSFDDFILK